MDEYILFHRNGGWFTRSAQMHSDWKQAQVFSLAAAKDMIKLHQGKLMPVQRALWAELMGASA